MHALVRVERKRCPRGQVGYDGHTIERVVPQWAGGFAVRGTLLCRHLEVGRARGVGGYKVTFVQPDVPRGYDRRGAPQDTSQMVDTHLRDQVSYRWP